MAYEVISYDISAIDEPCGRAWQSTGFTVGDGRPSGLGTSRKYIFILPKWTTFVRFTILNDAHNPGSGWAFASSDCMGKYVWLDTPAPASVTILTPDVNVLDWGGWVPADMPQTVLPAGRELRLQTSDDIGTNGTFRVWMQLAASPSIPSDWHATWGIG